MALTQADKKVITSMILRAVKVAERSAGPQETETLSATIEDPDVMVVQHLNWLAIMENLLPQDGVFRPGNKIITTVEITSSDEQNVWHRFTFPPNDEIYLNELRRIQNYPHLYARAWLSYRKDENGDPFIVALRLSSAP